MIPQDYYLYINALEGFLLIRIIISNEYYEPKNKNRYIHTLQALYIVSYMHRNFYLQIYVLKFCL